MTIEQKKLTIIINKNMVKLQLKNPNSDLVTEELEEGRKSKKKKKNE